MTSLEFQKDPQNRDELAKTLANPILQTALAALRDELEPRAGGPTEANPVLAAARYQQIIGANHILLGLPLLTKEPTVAKVLRGKPPLMSQMPPDDAE